MADTVRTLAALQALLADNSDQDISPQDIRDMLVSVFPPQYSGAGVKRITSGQAISAGTWTAIQWNGEDYDTDTYHDNSTNPDRLTVPSTGLYLVTGSIFFNNLDGDGYLRWNVNGTAPSGPTTYLRGLGSDSGQPQRSFAHVLQMTASEYVALEVKGDDACEVREDYSVCQITRIGQTPA